MNSDRFVTFTRGSLCLLLVWGVSGCGSDENALPRAAVRGTVKLDGVPLNEGVVRFVPAEGTTGPKTTVTVTEGKFEVPDTYGPIVGSHRVEIESTDDGGYAMDDEHAIERLRAEGKRQINVVTVPPIYNARTHLTAKVAADGSNEFDFTLTSNARRAR